MTVDAKRIQAVFRTALGASDSAQQAAILDRECGPDPEMRRRVEELLKEHEESTSIIELSAGTPGEASHSASDKTVTLGPASGPEATTRAVRFQDTDLASSGRDEGPVDEGPVELPLDFLQATTKPGSLGRLGHNEVLEVLGRGAFGIVVRAFDEKLQRVVAIKVLSPHLATTSPARKRFLREARASAGIRHENVVQIYAVEEQPLPYLVMEYIPGQTLQQRLDQIGPLDAAEVLRVGEQIARGLAAAHAQGLIHRDIKPGNVLLEGGVEPKVKITDFGLARAVDDASLTQSGVIAGTPLYMAPEQAKGEALDPRADLFSLGSVLYTMASGRPPFRASTPLAVLKRVAEDTPRPIREIVPEVPQWLCDLVARLHAKDPDERFQSAAEVADLFGRHLAHLQQPSLVARPDTVHAGKQSHRLPKLVVGAAIVVLAVLGAIFANRAWNSPGPTSDTPESSTAAGPPIAQTEPLATEAFSSHVLQAGAAVRTALIDFADADRWFGGESQDNPIRRAEQCNAFLVAFDLQQLGLPPKARIAKATASFYVWDPSRVGNTKVCAFPMKTAWDQHTVTWHQPEEGQSWRAGARFAFGVDTGPAGDAVVVTPEQGSDTVDPPIEYQLDVTDLVRGWMEGETPNHGLAIAPEIDTKVDEGLLSRFQVYGSQHGKVQYTPKLTVQVRQ